MQEFRGGEENKPHSYEVTKIELLDSPGERENPDKPHSDAPSNSENKLLEGSETANESDSLPVSRTTNNSISAAKLLNGVEKSYDSGKKLLDESKDLTDGEVSFRNSDNSSVKVSDHAPIVVKHIANVAEKVGGKVHFRTTPSAGTALDRYDRALNAHGYMATESFMDNMLSLKELMKAVDPTIKKIEDVKSSDATAIDNANKNIDLIMQDAVERLDKLQ